VLPIQDHVGDLALEIDEVNGSLSHHLEGEGVVAVPRIPRLRPFHLRIVAQTPTNGKLIDRPMSGSEQPVRSLGFLGSQHLAYMASEGRCRIRDLLSGLRPLRSDGLAAGHAHARPNLCSCSRRRRACSPKRSLISSRSASARSASCSALLARVRRTASAWQALHQEDNPSFRAGFRGN
jgi:hypothetical protein